MEKFKVINPRKFYYTIIIRDSVTDEKIKEIQLDPSCNEDAYLLAMTYYLDDKSIIEVDGKRYNVDDTYTTSEYLIIYV
jgi:hypothetical protein